jgi:hypothetical protein
VDDDLNATIQTNCGHKQNNKLLVISQPPSFFTVAMESPQKRGAGGDGGKGEKKWHFSL